MSNYEVIHKEPLSNSEVLDHIKKKEKEGDLTYREEKVRDFLKEQEYLDTKKFKELFEEIESLEIVRLDKFHIIKVIDIMPKTGTQLRAITAQSGIVLVDENAKKILGILNKYQK